jgi:multidrug efflux pump subunit AcrA (membrane-fusion protein)
MGQRPNLASAEHLTAATSDLTEDLAALRVERKLERPRRRWIGWMLVAVIAGASGVGAWRWITRERPIAVETAVVSERPAGAQAAILNATGYVTARRRATVSSKITGKLIAVNVEEGQAVRQGQVLARLDDGTLRASLALAHAQVDVAFDIDARARDCLLLPVRCGKYILTVSEY